MNFVYEVAPSPQTPAAPAAVQQSAPPHGPPPRVCGTRQMRCPWTGATPCRAPLPARQPAPWEAITAAVLHMHFGILVPRQANLGQVQNLVAHQHQLNKLNNLRCGRGYPSCIVRHVVLRQAPLATSAPHGRVHDRHGAIACSPLAWHCRLVSSIAAVAAPGCSRLPCQTHSRERATASAPTLGLV